LSAITHPAKHTSAKAIDQFIGSQAFIAACRIGHVCVEEFEDDENGERKPSGRVVFAHAKHNASRKMPTLAYHIEEVFAANDHATGEPIQAPKVIWADKSVDITADEAVAASVVTAPVKQKDRAQDRLHNLLIEMLRDGPQPAKDMEDAVAKANFTPNQLWTAKRKLGITSERKPDGWEWTMVGSSLIKKD
jgi:hypothetical protein